MNYEFLIIFMKSYRKELWFNTPGRRGFINITPQINACLAESGIKEGFVLANAMHITASVFINDDESGLHHDTDFHPFRIACLDHCGYPASGENCRVKITGVEKSYVN